MMGRIRRMVRRRRNGLPTWGWDFARPVEVHGYDVQFTDLGLRLALLNACGDVAAEGLLPFVAGDDEPASVPAGVPSSARATPRRGPSPNHHAEPGQPREGRGAGGGVAVSGHLGGRR